MTWLGQVLHVAAKDVRQARWMLLAYLAVAAFATLSALGGRDEFGIRDMSMVLVVIVGMFTAAFFIQADSPVRSDAFWASRPFHPGAVLAAKGMSALVVLVGVPLLGQLAVLAANDVSGTKLLVLLGKSVWVYSLWLLIAMLVAAVTRDLRTFTTVIVIMPVLMGIALVLSTLGQDVWTGGIAEPTVTVTGTAKLVTSTVVMLVGMSCAVMSLILLYRTRSMRRSTWAAVIAAVPCLFLTIFIFPQRRASAGASALTLAAKPGVAVEIRTDQGQTRISFEPGPPRPTNRLLTLDGGVLKLTLRNGDVIRLPVDSRLTLETPALPVAERIRWIGPEAFSRGSGGMHSVRLTRKQRDAVKAGVASASLEGTISAVEPRASATIPLRSGEVRTSDGSVVRIVGVNSAPDDSIAAVVRTSISGAGSPESQALAMSWWDTPRYALVNRLRGEAAMAGPGRNGGSTQALVLPGAWRWTEKTLLQRVTRFNEEIPIDNMWLQGAEVVVIDWKYVGRSKIHIDATLR
jgi:hypothetical protein